MENNPASTAPGFVRREYPIKEPLAADPAVVAIANELIRANKPNAPRNQLGASLAVTPGPENARVVLQAFCRKHFTVLAEFDDLVALGLIAEDVARERALIQFHSSPVCQQRIAAAMKKFAMAPTVENENTVRHEKSLTDGEHSLVQFHAQQRLDARLKDRVPQLGARIYQKASDLIGIHLAKLADQAAADYGEWNLAPMPSPLELELQRLRKEIDGSLQQFRAGSGGDGSLTGLLAILVEIDAEEDAKKAASKRRPK